MTSLLDRDVRPRTDEVAEQPPVHRPEGRRWPRLAAAVVAVAALAAVVAVLVTSHGNRSGPVASTRGVLAVCPPGAKCPAPSLPRTILTLTVDGVTYASRFGAMPAGERPLELGVGRPVAITIAIRTANVRLADVWLTVDSYPSGMAFGHPDGRYRLLRHHVGRLGSGQPVTAVWTPEPLFGTRSLDLTLAFTLGDAGVSAPIAHLYVAPAR